MKNILIDPVKQQLIPFQLPTQREWNHFYDAIGCDGIDLVSPCGNLILVNNHGSTLCRK